MQCIAIMTLVVITSLVLRNHAMYWGTDHVVSNHAMYWSTDHSLVLSNHAMY
jgi:hypothetical protein